MLDTSMYGPKWVETPPVRSSSAKTKEDRNSGRVLPPGRAKRRQPSGFNTLCMLLGIAMKI
jgi:hypothetical protein